MTEESIKNWVQKHVVIECDDPKIKAALEKKIINELSNESNEKKYDNQSSESR